MQMFFKRSTTYIPLLFVGAYFTNEVSAEVSSRVHLVMMLTR